MYANKNSAPKLLIVGGTSSLAPYLFKLAEKENFNIFATYREVEPNTERSDIRWLNLNFSDHESIDRFFLEIENLEFTRIIFLVGKSSGFIQENFSDDNLQSYFHVQLLQPIKAIDRLLSFLETEQPANFIFVSSRAALYGSYDWPYGVAKAGIQNFVTSASKFMLSPRSALSVASGLIVGSRMQMEMNDEVVNSHKERASKNGFRLMTANDFVAELWKLSPITTLEMNGKVVEIGAVY